MNKTKLLLSVAVIVIFLLVFFQIMPAAAYYLNPVPAERKVQLYFNSSDIWYLSTFTGYAADAVLYAAWISGIAIQRDKPSIEGEIRAHIIGYYRGYATANPMDIEMYPAPWWFYLLD